MKIGLIHQINKWYKGLLFHLIAVEYKTETVLDIQGHLHARQRSESWERLSAQENKRQLLIHSLGLDLVYDLTMAVCLYMN